METARRRRCLVLAAAFAIAAAGADAFPAQAQPPALTQQAEARESPVRRTTDYLARMDADRDGRVSLAEYQAWLTYGFDAMDRDHDGVLSAAELPGGRGAPLTREAHHARLAATFARQDRDHDGFLDAAELAAPPG